MTRKQREELEKITAEEIDEMWEFNENFVGHTLNMEKVQQYNRLRDVAREFFRLGTPLKVVELPPEPAEQVASIMIDLVTPQSFHQDEMELINRLIELADFMSVAYSPKNRPHIRLSLHVSNIWKD